MEQMTLYWVLRGLLILALALASIAERDHLMVEEWWSSGEPTLQQVREPETGIARRR